MDLSGRCEFIPIDFFVSVPSDCDRYLLKSVLHDWDNGDCLRILSNIRSAMPSGARLMVVERMLAARTLDDPSAVWLDLHMLCVTGGCERTLEEYRNLLGQAGFVLARAVPTELGFWVMEAMAK